MAQINYDYTISTDFPNGKVDPTSLKNEIQASNITVAFDYIGTANDVCSIWFKDELNNDNKNILDQIVSIHAGEIFIEPQPAIDISVPKDPSGVILTVPQPRTGSEVIYTTHNFCDKCAWFTDSIRVNNETLIDSGNQTIYICSNKFIIDMISGRLQDDDGLVDEQRQLSPENPHGYQVVVTVDGYSKQMREPLELSGGDYEVIWEDGYINFFEPLAPESEVKCSYSYATTSTFILHPLSNKNLHIEAAEADFTHDVIMTDGIEYAVWGYVDVFAPQYMYKRLSGYSTFENGGTSVIGIETLYTTEVTPGQYIRLEDAPPEAYMVVAAIISDTEILLAAPYAGESGTLTVACSNQFTGVYPSLTKIPLTSAKYKRFSNIIQEAVGSYPDIPAIGATAEEIAMSQQEFRRKSRGMKGTIQAIPFRYATLRELSSLPGLELRVRTSHDRALEGESATLTFYCTSHDL